jgi:hypothetical protein
MMYLDGKIQITPPLQGNHLAYLARFAQIRHMTWDVTLLEKRPVARSSGIAAWRGGRLLCSWRNNAPCSWAGNS